MGCGIGDRARWEWIGPAPSARSFGLIRRTHTRRQWTMDGQIGRRSQRKRIMRMGSARRRSLRGRMLCWYFAAMSETAVAQSLPVATPMEEDTQIGGADDTDFAEMKDRLRLMEEEADKLRQMQEAVSKDTSAPAEGEVIEEDKEVVDGRSVYVGNVDYNATPQDLQAHFGSCGTINRVTILCDKFTGHPKGYAYVEFADSTLVENATQLDNSLFKGRLIKVTPKRTNIPGLNRGRGRGRAGYRGGYVPRGRGYNPYGGRPRGRGAWRGAA